MWKGSKGREVIGVGCYGTYLVLGAGCSSPPPILLHREPSDAAASLWASVAAISCSRSRFL